MRTTASLLAALLLAIDQGPGTQPHTTTPTAATLFAARKQQTPPAHIRRIAAEELAQKERSKTEIRYPEAFELARFLREHKYGLTSELQNVFLADEDVVKACRGNAALTCIARHFERRGEHKITQNFLGFLQGTNKLNTSTALALIDLSREDHNLLPRTYDSQGTSSLGKNAWLNIENKALTLCTELVTKALQNEELADDKGFRHQINALATFGAHGDDGNFHYARFMANQKA